MQIRAKRHMIDFLFTLALFCVFAATALSVSLVGAKVYKNTVNNMDINFERRTSLSYVSTKIRQFNSVGRIKTADFNGTASLVLTQDIEGITFNTMIYFYDGALRELSVREGIETSPQNGVEIIKISNFEFEEVLPSLYKLTSTDAEGNIAEMLISTVESSFAEEAS